MPKPSGKAKLRGINLLLLFSSLLVCLIIGEGFTRVIFGPLDYLMPQLIHDDVLEYKIAPNSAGHDAWGYRNKGVPDTADIVAIGDSLTYGISATANNSWPAILDRLLGKRVYNLSLGGYGPPEYYLLLKTQALQLRPSLIVVGFYYGNDLLNSYNAVYSKDYWAYLRDPNVANDPLTKGGVVANRKLLRNFRDWLAHHSVLYRMGTFWMGDIYRRLEMKYYYDVRSNDITILDLREENIFTGFSPTEIFMAVNLSDQRVQEGLRISLKLFSQMNEICATRGITLVVLLLPTKENVFAKYLRNNRQVKNSHVVDQVLQNEVSLNELVKKELAKSRIPYIDPLEHLRDGLGQRQIYFSNEDGHPNKHGYEIIARTIQSSLQELHIVGKEKR